MKRFHFMIVLLVGALMFSGCDQMSSLFGGATKQKEKTPVEAVKKVPARTAEIKPNTIAKVGAWTLTVEEFNEQLQEIGQELAGQPELAPDFDINSSETRAMVLEELIRQQLLVEAAERQDIHKQKDIANAIEEFRSTLLIQELATRLTQNVQATEQDARDFYNENPDFFREEMQWRIREILVPDENRAKGLLVSLLQGADFAALAQSASTAPTAAQGGDRGFATSFEDPQIANMVLTLEPGGISSVFRGQNGFYIIKLEERIGGQLQSFEEIKEDLMEGLTMMQQQENVVEYIENLRNAADVYINEELLK